MANIISTKNFSELTRCLLEMNVSYVWRGFGTAIFLELGDLIFNDKRNNPKGVATVMLEFDWRVEKPQSIFFGSASGTRKITNGLRKLVGNRIVEVETEGRLPELILLLSNGWQIRSFTVCEPQPNWTLFLPDRNCLASNRGKIIVEACSKTKH